MIKSRSITKSFEHNKIESCSLTKKKINTDVEKWCVVIDYKGKNKINQKVYKSEDLVKFLKGNNQKIKKEVMKEIGDVSAKILNKALLPEVY